MFPRWLLTCALICGMLLAPLAMATARAHAPDPGQAASSHCAPSADADQHAPAQPSRCMGACAAVEIGVPRLATRAAPMPTALPRATMASLPGVLLERDTPPPRLA